MSLFRDIVRAPDREHVLGANPVIALSDDDEPGFVAEVQRRAIATYPLVRRGVAHGRVVELRPQGLVPPRPRRRRREALESERWVAAQPILLPGAADAHVTAARTRATDALAEQLAASDGLQAWLERECHDESPRPGELFDPERDLARIELGARGCWVKTGRLSTHPEDASLRLRVAFGREGDDDASDDEASHREVARVAERLLPGARELREGAELAALLERRVGGPVLLTQHIAYWNAPNGGARFHHDAFDTEGQLGVVYAQLSGKTVWLALSIEDLAARLREYASYLETPELVWEQLLSRRATTLAELGRPSCGAFATAVDDPSFTRFLTDAGHALVLHPGDVLVLPNHGLERTAMHSVFAGSRGRGYALSVGVRRG